MLEADFIFDSHSPVDYANLPSPSINQKLPFCLIHQKIVHKTDNSAHECAQFFVRRIFF